MRRTAAVVVVVLGLTLSGCGEDTPALPDVPEVSAPQVDLPDMPDIPLDLPDAKVDAAQAGS